MSVLRAGNTTLEDGKVRICVPIAYETEKEILEESMRIGKSSVADIAEWRIDWYQDVFQPRKRNALSRKIRENLQGKPLLVTFRSRREGGERDITPTAYQALLDEIIESNSIESNVVDLLDVELSQGMACVQELVKHAHQMGIGVIVSQHDFKKTPEASNLITTMEQMAGSSVYTVLLFTVIQFSCKLVCVFRSLHAFCFAYAALVSIIVLHILIFFNMNYVKKFADIQKNMMLFIHIF